ncbi:glycosyltransferase family 4 protein [Mesotoga sp. BH458_6_3_2_1]|uniref:glycosyltransferase family 4 protein n=1 Tax=Mesotoga sp. BH458_6_3_2_1 TaxID=1437446 RepID=UPI000EF1CEA3|nr:glycosyltransferase family 4 protein [Mesotoga sp. BH458_6_3_2_1]RLL85927.1 hypothetical protein Y697_13940 [Mesotoga sp. BH458_6_3_2_1]
MKVVFAHDHVFFRLGNSYYSNGGLSAEVLSRYTRIFDELVLLTRQQTINCTGEKLTEATIPRTRFVDIPNFKSIRTFSLKREASKRVMREIDKCDFVIARLPSSIGNIALKHAIKVRKPFLVELVGCPWDALWHYGSLLGKLLAPFAYSKTKKLVRNSKFVIYVSNEFLQRRYPTKGRSIGCSNVSIPEPDEKVLQNRLEKLHSRDKRDSLILGTAAAVEVKYKGQQYVIRALAKLTELGYNMEYHLAGSGSREFLSSVAKKFGVMDKVKFVGSVPREKILDYFDSIDIYIQPSKQEGLPRALIEAMSRGCPAIGSLTGGIPELLDSEFIFRNGSVSDIVRKIRSFDMGNMEQQAKINFEKAKEYHRDVLEKRRESFLTEFKRSIEEF